MLQIDPFINGLWRTYEEALKNGYNQPVSLSIFRCDYMLHQSPDNNKLSDGNGIALAMKQVEINTIAAGFGWVGTRMSQLHREIIKWIGCENMLEKVVYFIVKNSFSWAIYPAKKEFIKQ